MALRRRARRSSDRSGAAARISASRPQDLIGVNYVGYFRSHLGVAEAARNAVTALQAVGLDGRCRVDISQMAEAPPGATRSPRAAVRTPAIR